MEKRTILYVHGMGGGGDSRIPSILNQHIPADKGLKVVVRTYDFHPERAVAQIAQWVEELRPALVVGESLGSVQAIRIAGVPHILVSPSLGAPTYFGILAWLCLIPGVTAICNRTWEPRSGDRQSLHFTFSNLSGYPAHLRKALANSPRNGGQDSFFAFFGTRDHYRKSGTVSLRRYEKYFGNCYAIYDGTHFMEEEHIHKLLIPKIYEVLGI